MISFHECFQAATLPNQQNDLCVKLVLVGDGGTGMYGIINYGVFT